MPLEDQPAAGNRVSSFERPRGGAYREATRSHSGVVPSSSRSTFSGTVACISSRSSCRLISEILEAIGKPDFYQILAARTAAMLECDHYLVLRYSSFVKPVFLVNSFMHEEFESFYLDKLYRQDPLYMMIREGRHASVSTLLSGQEERRSANYRQMLFERASIADELALVLPVFGGAFIAVCLDRTPHSIAFDSASRALAVDLYPIIRQANLLHMERSLPSRGFGVLEGATTGVLLTTPDREVVCKNEAWNNLENSTLSGELRRVMELGCIDKKVHFGELVIHGHRLGPDNPISSNGNIFFVESSRGGGAVDNVFDVVASRYRLSPRERDLFTMALDGCDTRTIARRLSLSVGTIKNYKLRLYAKLGIKSEREMAPLLIGSLGSASTTM